MNSRLFEEFAFDIEKETPKEIIIRHTIEVDDIKLPQDVASFEEARRLATREGNIVRHISVDKEEKETSTRFSV